MGLVLEQLSQPLAYAEVLLAQLTSLSQAAVSTALLSEFVRGLADLSGCELVQFYLLDVTHTRLCISTEWLNGVVQLREGSSVAAAYNGDQLLQFALCQNRVVCMSHLAGSLHDTSFLPQAATTWQSLLCVPVVN